MDDTRDCLSCSWKVSRDGSQVKRRDLSEEDQEEAADSLSIHIIHHHSEETLVTVHSGARWGSPWWMSPAWAAGTRAQEKGGDSQGRRRQGSVQGNMPYERPSRHESWQNSRGGWKPSCSVWSRKAEGGILRSRRSVGRWRDGGKSSCIRLGWPFTCLLFNSWGHASRKAFSETRDPKEGGDGGF